MVPIRSWTTLERVIRTAIFAVIITVFAVLCYKDRFWAYPRDNVASLLRNFPDQQGQAPQPDPAITESTAATLTLGMALHVVEERLGPPAFADDAQAIYFGEAGMVVVPLRRGKLADDAGWRDFGCYGNEHIRTPNIDRLARSGLKADNAFLTIPQCSPSRISVLTGKYPHATGAEDLHAPLPVDQILIPTYLKRAGYYTGHMRKTHYGPNGMKQFDWYSDGLVDFPDFIDASGDKPFFLWVGFSDPHRPYQDNTIDKPHDPANVDIPPWLADTPETRADIARYYDEISRMDGVIGTYIKELKKRKLLDNTLIVFFSDNGEPFPRAE
ncbi:MAG: sulfatase-like hydrolase/transferase, partial [Planctomycetes bacterium]|nr:sulfatase-like hydrolase/transferase [Planctomycetota bacterium]